MDRCLRYGDTNLIWSERLGWGVFDPKHLHRFSEFVVGNSSHADLQRPSAERQISPERFDKARNAWASRPTKGCACCRLIRYLLCSKAFHVVFASISAMRPQGDGGCSSQHAHNLACADETRIV
jgi:hypothetical protein